MPDAPTPPRHHRRTTAPVQDRDTAATRGDRARESSVRRGGGPDDRGENDDGTRSWAARGRDARVGGAARRVRLDPVRLRREPHPLQPDGERRSVSATSGRSTPSGPQPPATPVSSRHRRSPTGSPTSARRRQAVRVQRGGDHELLGDPEDLRPAVDRAHRRDRLRRAVVAGGGERGRLRRLRLTPTARCTRSTRRGRRTARAPPRPAPRCGPRPPASTVGSSPTVANGVVYVGSGDGTLSCVRRGGDDELLGDPQDLRPTVDRAHRRRRPRLAGGGERGRLRLGNSVATGSLYAFDAAGTTNCSGTPKTCAPLWTATTGSTTASPAVANGVVYVGSASARKLAMRSTRPGRRTAREPQDLRPAVDLRPPAAPCSRRRRWRTGSSTSAPRDDAKLYAFARGDTNWSDSGAPCGPRPRSPLPVRRRRWRTGSSTSAPAPTGGQAACVRRGGNHELLGDPQDLHPAVDRDLRRRCGLVAGGGERGRLRRLRRPQAVCVRAVASPPNFKVTSSAPSVLVSCRRRLAMSAHGDRLRRSEEVARVVSGFDAHQARVVRAVVRGAPRLEVGVGEVLERAL